MTADILICGLISYEDPSYWNLCHKCIDATKSHGSKIRYLVGLDRVSDKNALRLQKYIPGIELHDVSVLPPKKRKETTDEKRHRIGNLYNKLFSNINDSNEYVCIMDGDIAFIEKEWDRILVNELTGNCVIIGAEYGPRWPEKFQGFPNLSFSLMRWPIIKKLNIDCCGSGKPIKVDKHGSHIFGLKVGCKLNREIGWKLPKAIREAGYDGKCMQVISGNSKKSQVINPLTSKEKNIYKMNKKTNIKGLFEIHWKGKAVITHLTKSTCLAFNEHPISKYWISKVNKRIRSVCT